MTSNAPKNKKGNKKGNKIDDSIVVISKNVFQYL